jgi:preprotein translocase subunit SecA
VLEGADLHEQIRSMVNEVTASYVVGATGSGYPEEWDLDQLWRAFKELYPISLRIDTVVEEAGGDRAGLTADLLSEMVQEDAQAAYDRREQEYTPELMRQIERLVVLSVLDRRWREHLYEMDYLREGIGLRAMAQRDPLVEYQREGFDMFNAMMDGIKEDSVGNLFNRQFEIQENPIVEETPGEEAPAVSGAMPPAEAAPSRTAVPGAQGVRRAPGGQVPAGAAPQGSLPPGVVPPESAVLPAAFGGSAGGQAPARGAVQRNGAAGAGSQQAAAQSGGRPGDGRPGGAPTGGTRQGGSQGGSRQGGSQGGSRQGGSQGGARPGGARQGGRHAADGRDHATAAGRGQAATRSSGGVPAATPAPPAPAPPAPAPTATGPTARGLEPHRPRQLQYSAPSEGGGVEQRRGGADEFANVGRNDQCPCGSGRKYKRCHGGPGSA